MAVVRCIGSYQDLSSGKPRETFNASIHGSSCMIFRPLQLVCIRANLASAGVKACLQDILLEVGDHSRGTLYRYLAQAGKSLASNRRQLATQELYTSCHGIYEGQAQQLTKM